MRLFSLQHQEPTVEIIRFGDRFTWVGNYIDAQPPHPAGSAAANSTELADEAYARLVREHGRDNVVIGPPHPLCDFDRPDAAWAGLYLRSSVHEQLVRSLAATEKQYRPLFRRMLGLPSEPPERPV